MDNMPPPPPPNPVIANVDPQHQQLKMITNPKMITSPAQDDHNQPAILAEIGEMTPAQTSSAQSADPPTADEEMPPEDCSEDPSKDKETPPRVDSPDPPELIKGKPAEFILNKSGQPTVLRGRSLENPGCSYLYQKKDKHGNVTRYQCQRCIDLKRVMKTGTRVSQLKLDKEKKYTSEADIGHDVLCRPYKDVDIGAKHMKRRAYAELRSGAGYRRTKAAHEMLVAKTGLLAMQEGVSYEEAAEAMPKYSQFQRSAFRNQSRGTAMIQEKFGPVVTSPQQADASLLSDYQRFRRYLHTDPNLHNRWCAAMRDLVSQYPETKVGTSSDKRSDTEVLISTLCLSIPEFPGDYESMEFFVRAFKNRVKDCKRKSLAIKVEKPCAKCIQKMENEDYKLALVPRRLADSAAFQQLYTMNEQNAIYALHRAVYAPQQPPPNTMNDMNNSMSSQYQPNCSMLPPMQPMGVQVQPRVHEQIQSVFEPMHHHPHQNPSSDLQEIFKDLSSLNPDQLRMMRETKSYLKNMVGVDRLE